MRPPCLRLVREVTSGGSLEGGCSTGNQAPSPPFPSPFSYHILSYLILSYIVDVPQCNVSIFQKTYLDQQ